jgi:hypothetical protein
VPKASRSGFIVPCDMGLRAIMLPDCELQLCLFALRAWKGWNWACRASKKEQNFNAGHACMLLFPCLADLLLLIYMPSVTRGSHKSRSFPLLPPSTTTKTPANANRLLQLLLWAELVGVSTLLLTAVGGTRGKSGLSSDCQSTVARSTSVMG